MPVSLHQNMLAQLFDALQSGISPGLSKSGCTSFAGTNLLAQYLLVEVVRELSLDEIVGICTKQPFLLEVLTLNIFIARSS